jgi:hypothetical protein
MEGVSVYGRSGWGRVGWGGVGACSGVLLRVNDDSLVLGIHARVPEHHPGRQMHGPIAILLASLLRDPS